jgi:hypothetical protein
MVPQLLMASCHQQRFALVADPANSLIANQGYHDVVLSVLCVAGQHSPVHTFRFVCGSQLEDSRLVNTSVRPCTVTLRCQIQDTYSRSCTLSACNSQMKRSSNSTLLRIPEPEVAAMTKFLWLSECAASWRQAPQSSCMVSMLHTPATSSSFSFTERPPSV